MFCVIWLFALPATSRVLEVGPKHLLKQPSEAAAVSDSGDVVRIDPGSYADCAIWTPSRLLIEGTGAGVVLAGKTCAGKGIFVIEGDDVTVRGITFADAKVDDHNGAGIRASGRNLTVERSRFLRNENGILAGGPPDSVLRITDSSFIGNGACITACAHGVYAGAPIGLLDIERCVFRDTRTAHHIKSRARSTIVRDSRIEDGRDGTSSYLIETPNGGNLLVQHDVLQKGARSSNRGVAISIGTEALSNPIETLVIRDNQFRNELADGTIFVRNYTAVPVELSGNTISGNVRLLEGPGGVSKSR
jgi:hypothetical protein